MRKLIFIFLIVLCGCSTHKSLNQQLCETIEVVRHDTVWSFQTEHFVADSIVMVRDTLTSQLRTVIYKPIVNRTDTTINQVYINSKEQYTAKNKSKSNSTIDWKFYTICGVLALLFLLTIYNRLVK